MLICGSMFFRLWSDCAKECYFYIIRLNEDTFKFGHASSLKLRKASYDIGRLQQVSFYCYVALENCADFEKEFSKNVGAYKIRGKHELVCMPQELIDLTLIKLLSR